MKVIVKYHCENGRWWAESDNIPGWSAASDSLQGLRDLTREAIDYFGLDDVRSVTELLPSGDVVIRFGPPIRIYPKVTSGSYALDWIVTSGFMPYIAQTCATQCEAYIGFDANNWQVS